MIKMSVGCLYSATVSFIWSFCFRISNYSWRFTYTVYLLSQKSLSEPVYFKQIARCCLKSKNVLKETQTQFSSTLITHNFFLSSCFVGYKSWGTRLVLLLCWCPQILSSRIRRQKTVCHYKWPPSPENPFFLSHSAIMGIDFYLG